MFDLLDPAEGVRLAADTRRRTGRSDDLWIQPTYLVAVENHCTCYVHFENAAVSRDRDRLSRARSSAIKRYFSHEMHVGPSLAVIISFHMRVGGGGG